MIEYTVLRYMSEHMSVPCYMMRPEDPPEEYVLIEKTGGSKENYITTSTFAFQSYAKTLLNAAELNEEVKAAADDLINVTEITKSAYQTDYNFTNPANKQPRYQAVFDITHY